MNIKKSYFVQKIDFSVTNVNYLFNNLFNGAIAIDNFKIL